MRTVRRSKTAIVGLQVLLAQGLPKFGMRVIMDKTKLVDSIIDGYLPRHARNGTKVPGKDFYRYDVSNTPFAVIYQFDDQFENVHFIIHKHADTRLLHTSDVAW